MESSKTDSHRRAEQKHREKLQDQMKTLAACVPSVVDGEKKGDILFKATGESALSLRDVLRGSCNCVVDYLWSTRAWPQVKCAGCVAVCSFIQP